jgi:hypothetical protein
MSTLAPIQKAGLQNKADTQKASATEQENEKNKNQSKKGAPGSGKLFKPLASRPADAPPGDNKKPVIAFNSIPLFSSPILPIQTKLTINTPGDKFEQEADAMAERVVQMDSKSKVASKAITPTMPVVQRKCSHCEEEEEKKTIQRKESIPSHPQVNNNMNGYLNNLHNSGTPLSQEARSYFEPKFGYDFSKVRIHKDAAANRSAQSINALAYTSANNIVFNSNQYSTQTIDGKRLLGHELTHVIQQSEAVQTDGFVQRKGKTAGGFFSNLGRAFLSIFGDEPDFSDDVLNKYLEEINSGEIEDDYDSDDKARIIVRKWKAKKINLTQQNKLMLIKEMLSGPTLGDDEAAILELLKGSADNEVGFLLSMIDPAELLDKINGDNHKELETILADVAKKKIQIGPEPVNVVKAERKDHDALLGDGTPLKQGITVDEFHNYITKQADWFLEPSLSEADKDLLWKVADTLHQGDYVNTALGLILLTELGAAIGTPDMPFIMAYAAGADLAAQTIRITAPHNKLTRIIELGKAMTDLKAFVPGLVLRICIDQAHFEKLVDGKLIGDFKDYYTKFKPTIENPKEADPLVALLKEGLAVYITLTDWVHDLHVFTPNTRKRLVKNITDKTRKRPVLLILMSGLDWNGAFLQAENLEKVVLNIKNLALLIQGATDLKGEIAKLDKVADDYGQILKGTPKPILGQVVIAGHGQDDSVEQITPGTNAKTSNDKTVGYDQKDLKFGEADGDSEKLIDEALQRMDPNQARIVFAGCLVGSHNVKAGVITSTKTAAAEINAAIKANPNLRDKVNARMAVLKIKGRVEAANASTQFNAFTLDASGKAKLGFSGDPDIGGTKDEYVKTGIEPEGALRAALETWADPNFGPDWTTKAMKKHVSKVKSDKNWYVTLTRMAFELALPAVGDVDPQVINDLAHRVSYWLFVGWEEMANVDHLAVTVRGAEAPKLFPAMLASDFKTSPHLPVVVQEAWMHIDATHEPNFMSVLQATALKRLKLSAFLSKALLGPHLLNLLKFTPPALPTKGQMLLALSMAIKEGASMPVEVKDMLIKAAGGVKTTKFPAALNVKSLLDGASELSILQNIGLAPGSVQTSGPPVLNDANLDTDNDQKNDILVDVDAHRATLKFPVVVQSHPNFTPQSKVIAKLAKGDVVNVVGTTNGWTVIDLKTKVGYVLNGL